MANVDPALVARAVAAHLEQAAAVLPRRRIELVEVFSIDTRQLHESTGAITPLPIGRNGIQRYRVRCKGQHCGLKNRNNRIYPARTTWGRHTQSSSDFMRRVRARRVIGHLEHPGDGRSDMKLGAVVITDVEAPNEAGEVFITFETMSTPDGIIVARYIEDGVGFGISSRGNGSVIANAEGVDIVQDDFDPQTFDAVVDESTPGAEVVAQRLKESRAKLLVEAHGDTAKAAEIARSRTAEALATDWEQRIGAAALTRALREGLADELADIAKDFGAVGGVRREGNNYVIRFLSGDEAEMFADGIGSELHVAAKVVGTGNNVKVIISALREGAPMSGAALPPTGYNVWLLSSPDGAGHIRGYQNALGQWDVWFLAHNLAPREVAHSMPTMKDAKLAAENFLRWHTDQGEEPADAGGSLKGAPAPVTAAGAAPGGAVQVTINNVGEEAPMSGKNGVREDYEVGSTSPYTGTAVWLHGFESENEAKKAASALDGAGFFCEQDGDCVCVHTTIDNPEQAIEHIRRVLNDKGISCSAELTERAGYQVVRGREVIFEAYGACPHGGHEGFGVPPGADGRTTTPEGAGEPVDSETDPFSDTPAMEDADDQDVLYFGGPDDDIELEPGCGDGEVEINIYAGEDDEPGAGSPAGYTEMGAEVPPGGPEPMPGGSAEMKYAEMRGRHERLRAEMASLEKTMRERGGALREQASGYGSPEIMDDPEDLDLNLDRTKAADMGKADSTPVTNDADSQVRMYMERARKIGYATEAARLEALAKKLREAEKDDKDKKDEKSKKNESAHRGHIKAGVAGRVRGCSLCEAADDDKKDKKDKKDEAEDDDKKDKKKDESPVAYWAKAPRALDSTGKRPGGSIRLGFSAADKLVELREYDAAGTLLRRGGFAPVREAEKDDDKDKKDEADDDKKDKDKKDERAVAEADDDKDKKDKKDEAEDDKDKDKKKDERRMARVREAVTAAQAALALPSAGARAAAVQKLVAEGRPRRPEPGRSIVPGVSPVGMGGPARLPHEIAERDSKIRYLQGEVARLESENKGFQTVITEMAALQTQDAVKAHVKALIREHPELARIRERLERFTAVADVQAEAEALLGAARVIAGAPPETAAPLAESAPAAANGVSSAPRAATSVSSIHTEGAPSSEPSDDGAGMIGSGLLTEDSSIVDDTTSRMAASRRRRDQQLQEKASKLGK